MVLGFETLNLKLCKLKSREPTVRLTARRLDMAVLSEGQGRSAVGDRVPSENLICPFAFPIEHNPLLKHRTSCVDLAEEKYKGMNNNKLWSTASGERQEAGFPGASGERRPLHGI